MPQTEKDQPLQLLREKAKDDAEILRLLYSMARDMSFRKNPDALLDQAIGRVAETMRVEAASLLLLNPDTGLLEFSVIKGMNAQAMRELDLRLKPDEGLAGWVFAHNKPAVVNDVANDPRFKAGSDWMTGFKTHNLVAVPMRLDGKPLGVLEVLNRRKRELFTDDDAEFLTAISHLVTTLLENVQTYRALEASQDYLGDLLQNLPGGYIGVDPRGRVTHCNVRALEILDMDKTPAGQTFQEAFESQGGLRDAIQSTLADRRPLRRKSYRAQLPRKGLRDIGYSTFCLPGRHGDILGIGVLFQDITGLTKE